MTDFYVRGGIRNRNPSKWATEDLRLKPRGHWDRPHIHIVYKEFRNKAAETEKLQ